MVQTDRIKTVAIVGCTAVGKSAIALDIAKRFNGELVGADSMQIYRGFDIGTGKLTKAECDGIAHHMIDIVDGDAQFSVGEYVERCTAVINDIRSRGKLPIIVGGTGMYVYSLLSGCNFANAPKDENTRNNIKLCGHFFGAETLHRLLLFVDSHSASVIQKNDAKRTVRALEIFSVTGKPKSTSSVKTETRFDPLVIYLTMPRDLLYNAINARVKKMFDDGLIEETKSLMKYKDCGSMQALGYKQIAASPNASRAELEALVAQKTRNYAKRQQTYFNNMKLDKISIDARDINSVINAVSAFTENK